MPYFWSDESSSVFHGLGLFHKISQLGRIMENFQQERESFNLKGKSNKGKDIVPASGERSAERQLGGL